MRISDWSSDVCSSDLTVLRQLVSANPVYSRCKRGLPRLARDRKILEYGRWHEKARMRKGEAACAKAIFDKIGFGIFIERDGHGPYRPVDSLRRAASFRHGRASGRDSVWTAG